MKYIVDVGLIISFLGVTFTGIVKFRSLWRILGININYEAMNMGLYRVVHDWSGLAMALLVLIHFSLNWSWIVAQTKNIFGRRKKYYF